MATDATGIESLCWHQTTCDGGSCQEQNHLALGDGEIDLIDRLNTARACNARCVLETKTIEALKKSVEWIKNDGN